MKKKWLICQPGKFLLILGMVLGLWTGYPAQGSVASAGQPQTVVFSDPIILLEVENSSGQELPVNQYDLGRIRMNSQSGMEYHDFGSNANDRVRIYADNGALRFGSPANPHNAVNLDMTEIHNIYAVQSNAGMYVYVVIGDGGNEHEGRIAVIGNSKNGTFTLYAAQDTWRKFYPADQEPLSAYYAATKYYPQERKPRSPIFGVSVYTVSAQQDSIAIIGTIRKWPDILISKWQYILKWNGTAGGFDIYYQRVQ